jgi:PA domain
LTAVLVVVLAGVASVGATFARAAATTPRPGVVAGGFCTYGTDYFKTSTEAAQRINQYFGTPSVPEIFHIGTGVPNTYTYTWAKTGTSVTVGQGKDTVQVDSGVAALRQAIGTPGPAGALSTSATNPTDMGTSASLGSQALAEKINQGFSEVFVTPATGFSGLSFVGMDGVRLDGVKLTPAQAAALDGQATLQVREAADAARGGGPLPYGLSFGQLRNLIELVNGSFQSCAPSGFAKAHLYQPYVTSNAFAPDEKRPSTVSTFASKPAYNTFSGDVVNVGRGCPANSFVLPGSPPGTAPNNPVDTYLGDPSGKIALIERGSCSFYSKIQRAQDAGAIAAIVFNSAPTAGCPTVPAPGANNCEALVGMGATAPFVPLTIPAAFVQRSTGLQLKNGAVTASVQQ